MDIITLESGEAYVGAKVNDIDFVAVGMAGYHTFENSFATLKNHYAECIDLTSMASKKVGESSLHSRYLNHLRMLFDDGLSKADWIEAAKRKYQELVDEYHAREGV